MFALLIISAVIATASAVGTTDNPALAKFSRLIKTQVDTMFSTADTNHNHEFDKGDMTSIFTDYDDNHDSAVSEAEFMSHFMGNEKGLGVIAKGLFMELDMNNSGSVTDYDLDLYFQKMDTNTDGHVSKIEFETYFTDLFTVLYIIQLKSHNAVG